MFNDIGSIIGSDVAVNTSEAFTTMAKGRRFAGGKRRDGVEDPTLRTYYFNLLEEVTIEDVVFEKGTKVVAYHSIKEEKSRGATSDKALTEAQKHLNFLSKAEVLTEEGGLDLNKLSKGTFYGKVKMAKGRVKGENERVNKLFVEWVMPSRMQTKGIVPV